MHCQYANGFNYIIHCRSPKQTQWENINRFMTKAFAPGSIQTTHSTDESVSPPPDETPSTFMLQTNIGNTTSLNYPTLRILFYVLHT